MHPVHFLKDNGTSRALPLTLCNRPYSKHNSMRVHENPKFVTCPVCLKRLPKPEPE